MKRIVSQLLLDTLCLADRGTITVDGWARVDADGLLALVHYEGAELWLSRRLQQRGITLPDDLRTALRGAVRATTLNNMRIDEQTVAVTSLLTSADLPWALIKGQARRAATDRYPMADARPVSDVDLLVPTTRVDEAWALLRKTGFRRVYEEGDVDFIVTHHLPALIDDSNVSVELHRTFNASVQPQEAWRRATDQANAVSWSGISTTVPNATELFWQALTHGVADSDGGLFLRTFLNVSIILASAEPIQWTVIEERLAANEVLDNETGNVVARERLCQWLNIASMLAGVPVPRALQPQRHVDISTILAWRGTVLRSSLSRRVKRRLLGEMVRLELGLPFTRVWGKPTVLRRLRAYVTSAIWRTCYRIWRAQA